MSRRDRWTADEIGRVLRLRKYLPLREIAPLYQTNENALKQVLWRHRHGIRKGQADEVEKTRRQVVELAEAGETNAAQIARDVGIPAGRCHKWLRRAGLDREMRDENAREMRRAAMNTERAAMNTVDSLSAM